MRAGGLVVVLALALAAAPLWLHAPAIATASGGAPSVTTASGRAPAVTAASGRAAAAVTLTPRQMAGQRVIYSYTGLKPPASLLSLIRHGEAAGVIFHRGNIASRAQIRGVIRELARADASAQNPVRAPLLLMTDQEGGQVRRLSGAPLLSEKQIGASGDPAAAATRAGTNAGRNLRGVGMNVNLAPVLDVFRKAGDFDDQYGRSYSKSPAVVSVLGADFIAAQQQVGVAATAKHFPGLGAAARSQNTDLRPVTLKLSKSTIRNVDELPYTAAIAAGVKLVMVSWAVYPALDHSRPAGMLSAIVQGELRGRLGFGGVTITDALEAGSLRALGTFGHRAELAAGAGMDLILCGNGHVAEGEQAMTGLQSGYLHGALDKAAFRASVQRVIELRSSLGG
ncbi:MAG: glycoside hydrolase family 3 N-terminal domain-containing protein [Thermoleophilia bacterium]